MPSPAPIIRLAALFLLLLASPPASQAQTVTPQPGEGIWGLLRRSGIEPTNKRVAAFKELNRARLGDGDQLKVGVKYQLGQAQGWSATPQQSAPATQETPKPAESTPARQVREYPIFGPEYAQVTRKSNRLAGHYYYLTSGHGGPDPGSVGRLNGRTMPEDEIAYDTALRIARRLLEEGASVYMIVRDKDDGIRDQEYLPPDWDEYYYGDVKMSRNYQRRIHQRAEVINRLYERNRSRAVTQQVISVHVDAMAGRHQPQIDVHFAYSSDRGRTLGRSLQTAIRAKYQMHQPNRGYNGRLARRDLYILKHTKPTAVLVELGNIRHRGDQVRLTKPGNRQALAEWIADGLIQQVSATRRPRRAE